MKVGGHVTSHAGIALFLFGTKQTDDGVIPADGMEREFEVARSQQLAVIPIGSTGGTAKTLSDRVIAEPDKYIWELGADGQALIERLAQPLENLSELVDPIMNVIHELQGGNVE